MFRFGNLALVSLFFAFAGCGCKTTPPPDAPVKVGFGESTELGLVAEAPYKISEIDPDTGERVRDYFALGKDIDVDPFSGTISFVDLDGESHTLRESFEWAVK